MPSNLIFLCADYQFFWQVHIFWHYLRPVYKYNRTGHTLCAIKFIYQELLLRLQIFNGIN